MLVKASILATVLVCAVVSLSRVDFRELYNEMYPVNGLRRGVLTLCHQAEPTFVRAIEADRVGCYDGMPDPVERAIGWVRTSSRLAALRRPTPVELAERLLAEAITTRQLERLAEPRFTGYAMLPAATVRPCEDAPAVRLAAAVPADWAVASSDGPRNRRIAGSENDLLAALGLAPRGLRKAAAKPADLPILSLGGAGDSAALDGRGALLDPAAAADLGGDSAALLAPRVAASGCKTPA